MAHAHPQSTRPGPNGLGRAGAAAGLPPAGAAGEVPAELVLRMGPGKPSGLVDRAVHLSVLKELLGPEIRGIIRAELASAIALSPDGLANQSRRRSLHRVAVAEGTIAAAAGSARPLGSLGTRQDDYGSPCNTQCHSYLYEEVENSETEDEADTEVDQRAVASARSAHGGHPAPPTVAIASADVEGGMAKPLLPAVDHAHPGPEQSKTRRLSFFTSSETMEITKHAAEKKRLESHWLAERFPSLASHIFQVDGIIAQIGSESMEAPEPSNKLSQIADSCWFQTAGNIATLLNCGFLTYMADWNFENYSKPIPDLYVQIDNTFLVIFSLELGARLARHQLYYFVNSNYFMNWMDLIIVVSGWMEFAFASAMGSMSFLRQLRALRLLKVLRLFRVLRMFRTLQVVFDSLANTVTELVWCALTLVLIEYMFALMIVMRAGTFLRDDEDDTTTGQIDELREKFGSISSAVLSLFTVSMGAGDWSNDYKLLSLTGHATQAIYLVFVVFAFIAVLNVILGIFVEKAMKNLAPSREEQAQQHAADEMEMVSDVKALCMEGDEDANGKLSLAEWQEIFSEGKIAAYMDGKGFRSHDLRAYFDICAANSDGEIDIEDFVRGCCQLRGPASCFDVKTMLLEFQRICAYMEEHFAVSGSRPVAAG